MKRVQLPSGPQQKISLCERFFGSYHLPLAPPPPEEPPPKPEKPLLPPREESPKPRPKNIPVKSQSQLFFPLPFRESKIIKIIKINPRGGYFALLGYLISKIPDQIMKSENINSLLKKSLRRILRILLTYILTPLFLKLDYADTTKSFTLGYICEAKKVFSLHSGKRA